MPKTLVVKENNMSSKFATPFLNKSPLEGAYTSGADGMVYASNRRAFQKLQDDIVSGAKIAIKSEKQNKKYQDYKNLPDNEFIVKYGMNKEDYIAAINKTNKEKK
tara:strand:+ start:377 stop:691 length:315 start_codon:yes stop_codon:yes gene_type:complete